MDPFDGFEPYVRQRLAEDPHLWGTALFDEAKALGYGQSCVTLVRKIRIRELRPLCGACGGTRGRAVAIIDHPAGEECQSVLGASGRHPVGISRVRAGRCAVAFGEVPSLAQHCGDQAHLVEGIDAVLRRLGGSARRWRVDRMATVLVPGTDRVQASFVGVAKHYGVGIDACPPRRPNRKGVVEKAIHYIAQRWWRTAAVGGLAQAQDSLDQFCERVGDARRRAGSTVGELADGEPLLDLPAVPYPAEGTMVRKVAANGLVSVWGNQYSVPPSVIGTEVSIRWRLSDPSFDVVSASGRLIATHRKVPRGQGRMVRLPEHTAALEKVVLASFTTAGPCKPKPNRPPSQAALAIAADVAGSAEYSDPVIDLAVYQTHIDRQNRSRR